jgi:hypothetical protein
MTDTMIMNDPLFDALQVEALPPEALSLTSSQIMRAIQLSQNRSTPDRQWQMYLGALAEIGFEQWLQARSPDLAAKIQSRPFTENLISSTPLSLLQVGDFRLCLLTVSSGVEDRITVPIAVVNELNATPHFYVLIEVWEEQGCVNIYGYLRRDRLVIDQQTELAVSGVNTTAWLFLEWFDPNVDTLLLYLRCLNPDAIAVSQDSTVSQLSSRVPTINVAHWLRNQLDDIAQELSWVLLPPLAVTFRDMGTSIEQFDSITMALLQQGVAIPFHARGAYQNLEWENAALRLYVVTWQEAQSTPAPEFSLLLILGAQPGDELPIGTKLIVEDDLQQLDEQILTEQRPDTFLFTRVIGIWNEQFQVTIILRDETAIRLPPFRFQPNN